MIKMEEKKNNFLKINLIFEWFINLKLLVEILFMFPIIIFNFIFLKMFLFFYL